MLDLGRDNESLSVSSKTQKVQLNLKKITSLIKGALRELKESQRVSTNQSDSSQNQHPLFIHRMSIDLHIGKTETFLESLQKGYVMVKHSPNAKPKEKYIYVSSDRRFLCWKSLDKDDEKRIQLKKIKLVLRGEDQTICYVQSKSIKKFDKFLIVKSESRDLELQAFNEQESMKFEMEMNEAIRNAKSIHLSYQV